MPKWIISCITMMLCVAVKGYAQNTYADKVQLYIQQYKNYAIAEQKRSGVPAAVTLGQGILETDAGCSELVTGANNHFGIKCKKEWTGETFSHTDDAPNECFRKYGCAADSYKDHSEYLKTSPRYAALFRLSPTDYAAWAFGLKRCGYATSPTYAQRLINIIENFRLQEFTYQALNEDSGIGGPDINAKTVSSSMPPVPAVAVKKTDSAAAKKDSTYTFKKHQAVKQIDTVAVLAAKLDSPIIKKADTISVAASIPDSLDKTKMIEEAKDSIVVNTAVAQPTVSEPAVAARTHPGGVTKINGIKAIYVYKGEMLLQYALKYNIRYAKLLEINELPDAPLAEDTYIYLERKNIKGAHATHLVAEGESMRSISQDEGIQIKKLYAYNKMAENEQPVPGVTLQLQSYATAKPKVIKTAAAKKVTPPVIIPVAQADTAANKASDMVATERQTAEPVKDAAAITPDTVANSIKTELVQNDKAQAIPESKPVETKPAPIAEEKKEAVKTQEAAPPVVVAATPLVQAAPDIAQVSTANLDPKQQEEKEELDNLKAKLDKLVYANDDADAKPAPQLSPEQKQAQVRAEEDAKYYTVQGGDTAYSIARNHGISMHQLLEWNNLNFNQIKVGQRLRVKP